jgi:hypothetical protein
MMNENIDWKPILWTTAIVAVTTIVIGEGTQLLMRNIITRAAYAQMQGFFLSEQSDYFPLLFLVVALGITFSVVWLYRMLLPQLPLNWVYRGILIGGFLFMVSDLPNALITGFTTAMPSPIVQGIALTGFINKIINGCLLTYFYRRFSSEQSVDNKTTLSAQVKKPRI